MNSYVVVVSRYMQGIPELFSTDLLILTLRLTHEIERAMFPLRAQRLITHPVLGPVS